jgi:uroporphyrinogen-III decarboxylase
MSSREERNSQKMQSTFVLPRVMKYAASQNWPAPAATFAQVNEYIPQTCKVPYDYLFRDDGRAMAECTLLIWEYTGLDMLGANHDFYNFEAESIGAKINFYKGHIPDVDRNSFFIKDESDLGKIKFNGLDSGRYRYLIEYCHAYTEYIGLDVFPSFCAPWSLACNLYGLENLIIAAHSEPQFVHDMLHRIVYDLQGPMLKAMAGEIPGFSMITVADAWSSPPMVSLDMIREFTIPYTLRLPEAVGMDVPVINTGLWGASCFGEELRDAFMDCVRTVGVYASAFDPDTERVGPEYFRDYADRTGAPLLLGFSTTFLENAGLESIVERTKRYTLAGKNGKTPLLFFYNNFAPHTPIDNIRASIAAVHVYGTPEADADTPFELPGKAESFEEFLKSKLANNAEGYTFNWLEKSGYAHLLKG